MTLVGSNPTQVCLHMVKVFGCVGKLVTPVDCKSAASGTAGSTPAASTKNLERVFAQRKVCRVKAVKSSHCLL